jgi:hypothetical protein
LLLPPRIPHSRRELGLAGGDLSDERVELALKVGNEDIAEPADAAD